MSHSFLVGIPVVILLLLTAAIMRTYEAVPCKDDFMSCVCCTENVRWIDRGHVEYVCVESYLKNVKEDCSKYKFAISSSFIVMVASILTFYLSILCIRNQNVNSDIRFVSGIILFLCLCAEGYLNLYSYTLDISCTKYDYSTTCLRYNNLN